MRLHRLILCALLALVLGFAGLVPSTQPASAADTYNESSGPNYSRRVILTFDDCPRDLASFTAVVKYGKKKNDAYVLAITGDCLKSFRAKYNVDLAKLARSYGQYVINHSVSHVDLRTLTCAGVERQLKSPGVVTNFGRPPHGYINSTVRCGFERVGMRPWLWNASTADWTGKTQSQVVQSAIRIATPGSTILLHMQWAGFNPTAIRQIKFGLAERGMRLCRAYRGMNNVGRIITSPVMLPTKLPC